MDAKKLSLVAFLAISSSAMHAKIIDLSYTKADLATLEKSTALAGTCRSIYKLLVNEDVPVGNIKNVFQVAEKVDEFTDAALEGDDAVNRVNRLADACVRARNNIAQKKGAVAKFDSKDYIRMTVAFTAALAQELAQGYTIKRIKKNFAEGDQQRRLYRRALYVAKDLVLSGLFDVVEKFADVNIYGADKGVDGKEVGTDYVQVAKDAVYGAFFKSLARQIIGEILVSNAEDDSAAPIVLNIDRKINAMC